MDSNKNSDYFKIINATFISYIFHGLLFVVVVFISLFQKKNSKRVSGRVVSVATIVYFLFVFGGFLFFSTFSIEINWKIVQNVNKQTGTHIHSQTQMYTHTYIYASTTNRTHTQLQWWGIIKTNCYPPPLLLLLLPTFRLLCWLGCLLFNSNICFKIFDQ